MKRYILLLTALIAVAAGFAQSAEQRAVDAYDNKNYPEVIEIYGKLMKEKGVSPLLYSNLGDAYYRSGDKGRAVLCYERALRLDPKSKEANANLDFVKTKLTDRIDEDENILYSSIAGLRNSLSTDGWAVFGMAAFLLFIAGFVAYTFGGSIALRKFGFFGGIVMLLACVAANSFAYSSHRAATDKSYAIVLNDSTMLSTVSRAPINRSETAFMVHGGTKVKKLDSLVNVSDSSGIWYKVRTLDKREGWVSASAIETI